MFSCPVGYGSGDFRPAYKKISWVISNLQTYCLQQSTFHLLFSLCQRETETAHVFDGLADLFCCYCLQVCERRYRNATYYLLFMHMVACIQVHTVVVSSLKQIAPHLCPSYVISLWTSGLNPNVRSCRLADFVGAFAGSRFKPTIHPVHKGPQVDFQRVCLPTIHCQL